MTSLKRKADAMLSPDEILDEMAKSYRSIELRSFPAVDSIGAAAVEWDLTVRDEMREHTWTGKSPRTVILRAWNGEATDRRSKPRLVGVG